MSTDNVREILEQKRREVRAWRDGWCALAARVGELMDPAAGDAELTKATRRIVDAVSTFERETEHPTVTLATTGTTSGGKSSLVNMLCGAELMPVAVQEMSAGMVTVRHTNGERRVSIQETPNADWDCGTWEVSSADEVRGRLQTVMDRYRNLRQQNREPAPPVFEVLWPTEIGARRTELLGLPEDCSVNLLDLPGLKYIGDTANANVIREGVQRALCLVTTNAEDTDETKLDELLDKVIEQIKQLGGSPARMLFMLNRFDAFLRDRNASEFGELHVRRCQQRFRDRVADALKEHAAAAQRIEVLPLSSGPGRMALTAQWSSERRVRVEEMRALTRFYRALVREDLLDELPGNPERWSDHDLSRVAQDAVVTSGVQDFFTRLKEHAAEHLPELLVGHLLSEIRDAANQGLSTLDQILFGELKRGDDTYETEVRRLREARANVNALVQSQGKELSSFRDLRSKRDPYAAISKAAEQASSRFSADFNRMSPLFVWHEELGKAVEAFFDCIQRSIRDASDPSQDPSVVGLPPSTRAKISTACRSLITAGYQEYALEGKTIEVSNPVDKERLRDLNVGLNDLSAALAEGLRCVFEQRLAVESRRAHDALQHLLEAVIADTTRRAAACAPEFAGLHLAPPALARITATWRIAFPFKSGFDINHVKRSVQTGVERRKVQTGTTSHWYFLWLDESPVYETHIVPVHEVRDFNVATIPKLASVLYGFMEQAKAVRPINAFEEWLQQSIDSMLERLSKHFSESLSRYQQRLDNARERAGNEKREHDELWLPLQGSLRKLSEEFAPVGFIG